MWLGKLSKDRLKGAASQAGWYECLQAQGFWLPSSASSAFIPLKGGESHCTLWGRGATCAKLCRREHSNRDWVSLMEALGEIAEASQSLCIREGMRAWALMASENKRLLERKKSSNLISTVWPRAKLFNLTLGPQFLWLNIDAEVWMVFKCAIW